jgi:hypothetical protein
MSGQAFRVAVALAWFAAGAAILALEPSLNLFVGLVIAITFAAGALIGRWWAVWLPVAATVLQIGAIVVEGGTSEDSVAFLVIGTLLVGGLAAAAILGGVAAREAVRR